ncbi:MAG TPA: DUF692 domain-containing protein [Thermoanaerobaculia bacterium]|nr:DUF692 domain-containing protein [Thermoanaerobaculia bacterium]
MSNRWNFPDLGIGVGLRTVHFPHILTSWPKVDWFEAISENFMDSEGRPMATLEEIAERYPIVLHGVSMSIGSTDPLDLEYLRKLKALARRVDARWISDHLCWTGVSGRNVHDLLPLPYSDEVLNHLVKRIRTVSEILERPLIVENVSSYVEFAASTTTEWDFLARVAEEADCGLLLDVNNIYVSSFNHGFDPAEYVDAIPADRVVQFHLAGHTNKGTHILDTHSDYVIDAVWDLYARANDRTGPTSTLLEWDENIPDFEIVHREALKARAFRAVIPEESYAV